MFAQMPIYKVKYWQQLSCSCSDVAGIKLPASINGRLFSTYCHFKSPHCRSLFGSSLALTFKTFTLQRLALVLLVLVISYKSCFAELLPAEGNMLQINLKIGLSSACPLDCTFCHDIDVVNEGLLISWYVKLCVRKRRTREAWAPGLRATYILPGTVIMIYYYY